MIHPRLHPRLHDHLRMAVEQLPPGHTVLGNAQAVESGANGAQTAHQRGVRLSANHTLARHLKQRSNPAAAREAERAVAAPRPLMLIHGLADDNVVVAHTLRLSAALLAARYPHTVLPLSGITHMASQETVAENLLLLQLDFLRRALGLPADSRPQAPGRAHGQNGGNDHGHQ